MLVLKSSPTCGVESCKVGLQQFAFAVFADNSELQRHVEIFADQCSPLCLVECLLDSERATGFRGATLFFHQRRTTAAGFTWKIEVNFQEDSLAWLLGWWRSHFYWECIRKSGHFVRPAKKVAEVCYRSTTDTETQKNDRSSTSNEASSKPPRKLEVEPPYSVSTGE